MSCWLKKKRLVNWVGGIEGGELREMGDEKKGEGNLGSRGLAAMEGRCALWGYLFSPTSL